MNLIKSSHLHLLILLLITEGCSTTSGSIASGAGVGGAMGAGVGALADPGKDGQNRFRNVVIGSAVGAVLGAGTGYALNRHDHDEREDAKKEGVKEADDEMRKRNSSASSGGAPELIAPKNESKWVPDQVRGSTFVPGHFEFIIVEAAHWQTNR